MIAFGGGIVLRIEYFGFVSQGLCFGGATDNSLDLQLQA